MEGYLNTMLSPKERTRDLLAKLTLEEKMAQIRGIMPFGYPGDKLFPWCGQLSDGYQQGRCL